MNENKTNEIIEEGDKFLILLDSILELISDWKQNYIPAEDENKQLAFNRGEFIHFVGFDGSIDGEIYNPNYHYGLVLSNRAFKSESMAELFRQKSQLIADSLFWKELFDRDYKPNWEMFDEPKYFVVEDRGTKMFMVACNRTLQTGTEIYFSTEEIAQGCADWMNARKEKKQNV